MRNEYQIKEAFSQSLLDLLETKSFTNITVCEIAKNCSLSTRTFYNYFLDKNDLVSYIWMCIHRSCCQEGDHFCSLEQYFNNINVLQSRHKYFYFATLISYKGQNNLWETIFNTAVEGIISLMKQNGYEEEITDEIVEIVRFYVHGILGVAKEGLSQTKPKIGRDEFAFNSAIIGKPLQMQLLPEQLKEYLNKQKS